MTSRGWYFGERGFRDSVVEHGDVVDFVGRSIGFYELKGAIPKGYAPLRLQIEIEQMGDTESGSVAYSNFSAVDSEGQQFEATTFELFQPSLLADGTLELTPGDSRLGYIAIPVPADAEIAEITMHDAGFVPPNTATWTIDS